MAANFKLFVAFAGHTKLFLNELWNFYVLLGIAVQERMSVQTTSSPTEDQLESHFTLRDRKMDETPEQYDIFQQLAKKDRDLELAAELGKVLLQENEELKLRLDQLNQEYMQKLEVIVECVTDVLF